MTKITKLDRTALQNLRAPIEAELKALGDRLGLSFNLGNGTFGDGAEASFKLVIRVDDPETKVAAAKADWDRNCRYIGVDWNRPDETGLRPEDFGTEFEANGATYRTTGLSKGRGKGKFPITVEVVSDPTNRLKPGDVRIYGEQAVPTIRAATDSKSA